MKIKCTDLSIQGRADECCLQLELVNFCLSAFLLWFGWHRKT